MPGNADKISSEATAIKLTNTILIPCLQERPAHFYQETDTLQVKQ
jgi:hypothetical protein